MEIQAAVPASEETVPVEAPTETSVEKPSRKRKNAKEGGGAVAGPSKKPVQKRVKKEPVGDAGEDVDTALTPPASQIGEEDAEPKEDVRKEKLLVHKAIRNYLKEKLPQRIHCGTQALVALEARLCSKLDVAAQRVLQNRRKTMKPCDV